MARNRNNPEEEARDWEFPSGKELGVLLKSRREELGLTHAQVSEQTKLRPHFIEALENEDWDHLPSPAFVKGFIRSYARILGLSEEGLIALYQEVAPQAGEGPGTVNPPPARKKGRILLYIAGLVLVACAAGAALYFWAGGLIYTGGGTGRGVETSDTKAPPEPAGAADEAEVRMEVSPPPEQPSSATDQAHPGEEAPDPRDDQKQGEVAKGPEAAPPAPSEKTPPAETAVPQAEQDQAAAGEEPPQSAESAPIPDPGPARAETSAPPEPARKTLVLKAVIRERTWIRLRADNEKPKEYILKPGTRHEWGADNCS